MPIIFTESVVIHDRIRAGRPSVLLIVGEDPFEPLLTFFRERGFSLSAERGYAQSVGRFIEWLSVRATEFASQDQRGLLYGAFVHDLRFGTQRDGYEDIGLNWRPVSDVTLKRLSRCLVEFSDWLCLRRGTEVLNPIHNSATYADQIAFWRRWNRQKATSLLAHTMGRSTAATSATKARRITLPTSNVTHLPEAKAFPLEHIHDLLWKGFVTRVKGRKSAAWQKYRLRDMLITLLCLYGGCRESEPLHLWVDDVCIDPDDREVALVLIHHPEQGAAFYVDPITKTKKRTTRADFLKNHCGGKLPLTLETGRRHSGWKGALLTRHDLHAYQVFWIDKDAGRLFLTLWRAYVQHVRPLTPQTPWAFLTKDGQPFGVQGYSDAFEDAVRRIGLTPEKWLGTTSHALRHRYGQWLNDLGLGDKEGQVAMHHLNPKSQEVYRQMGVAQVAAAIKAVNVTSVPNIMESFTE